MARLTRGSLAREQMDQSPPVATQQPVQLSSPPPTPDRLLKTPKSVTTRKKAVPAKNLPITPKTTPRSPRKRTRVVLKDEGDANELPHNLGKIPDLAAFDDGADQGSPSKKPRRRIATKKATPKKEGAQNLVDKKEDVQGIVDKATGTVTPSPKKATKKKHVLTPGITPYPDWPHPTPEECEEVTRLLSSVHGEVKAPKVVPPPSLEVSGCGEVPSVLDALIRTLLSANTSGTNSSRAFAGLVKRFGILEEGIGKGSVNWNNVRLATTQEVFDAIKSGGMADVKSKYIKAILQLVWEENQARRGELIASGATAGSSTETPGQKHAEIEKADDGVLSLDHVHHLSTEDAFQKLASYPGIGAKTASCILLFCLQRPSFAVDTHVFRFCEWLGWVPPPGSPALLSPGKKGKPGKPDRDRTFFHCEVRIPDHLKYPLHQLFIRHGKTCPRCRSNTSESYADWKEGCVIDHLVKRTGKMKGGVASPKKGGKVAQAKSARAKKGLEYETGDESSVLSEPESDVEDEERGDTALSKEESD